MEGFIIGRDPAVCDVVVAGQGGISAKHVALTFNWEWQTLLVRNLSRNGTTIKIHRERDIRLKEGSRDGLQYSFPATKEAFIFMGAVGFRLTQHLLDSTAWQFFRSRCEGVLPPPDNHEQASQIVASSSETPFVETRFGKLGRYILQSEIGNGRFGLVREALNVKTGEVVAAKQFLNKRGMQDKRWLEEITLNEKLNHVYPACFIKPVQTQLIVYRSISLPSLTL